MGKGEFEAVRRPFAVPAFPEIQAVEIVAEGPVHRGLEKLPDRVALPPDGGVFRKKLLAAPLRRINLLRLQILRDFRYKHGELRPFVPPFPRFVLLRAFFHAEDALVREMLAVIVQETVAAFSEPFSGAPDDLFGRPGFPAFSAVHDAALDKGAGRKGIDIRRYDPHLLIPHGGEIHWRIAEGDHLILRHKNSVMIDGADLRADHIARLQLLRRPFH